MLFPLATVTAVGVTVGLFVWVVRARLAAAVLSGVVGAWAGFVVGGLVGVAIDMATRSGDGVILAGHGAAAVGAFVATQWEARLAAQPAVWDRPLEERSRAVAFQAGARRDG